MSLFSHTECLEWGNVFNKRRTLCLKIYPTPSNLSTLQKNTRYSKYYGKNSYESLEICDKIVVDEFEDKKNTKV